MSGADARCASLSVPAASPAPTRALNPQRTTAAVNGIPVASSTAGTIPPNAPHQAVRLTDNASILSRLRSATATAVANMAPEMKPHIPKTTITIA